MKICFKFGDSVICLPSKAVSERLSEATREELCVLLYLASNPDASSDELCTNLGIDNDEFMKAVSFWRGSGAIGVTLDEGEKLPSSRKKSDKKKDSPAKVEVTEVSSDHAEEKKPAKLQSASTPSFSTSEIADFLESDPSLRVFIENCQQILGKIFSSAEAVSLIGTTQYLGVSTEYMALLCAFAVSHGKKSVRYIEKMAIGLYDDGITKYGELETHLKMLNHTEEMKPRIRQMFGLGERAFTAKEKKFIEKWCGEFEFDLEMIRKAYEITVTNTGKAAMPYCNTILESWHSAGYKTAAEVDRATEEYKRKKAEASGSSFDVDDFFEAALKRSYGPEGIPNGIQ